VARAGATDIGAFESRGFQMAIAGGNNQVAVTGAVLRQSAGGNDHLRAIPGFR
jgi:hypothetical protein